MSLDELIIIERVEFEKSRIQETYSVDNLLLSRLYGELIIEVKKDILPILDMYILIQALQSVPFTDEVKGIEITETLSKWVNEELYGKVVKCSEIVKKLKELNELILYDYLIEGSLTVGISSLRSGSNVIAYISATLLFALLYCLWSLRKEFIEKNETIKLN